MARHQTPKRTLAEHAGELLAFVAGLDPQWKTRIEIAREVKRWSDWQMLGAWVGYMLDHGLHLAAPDHPLFGSGLPPRKAEEHCERCGKPFRVEWPGHRFCGNACAEGIAVSAARQALPPAATATSADAQASSRGAEES